MANKGLGGISDPNGYEPRLVAAGDMLSDIPRPRLRPLRRLGGKVPTPEQMKKLIRNGRLMLPEYYVRGYFLDLEI
ncbi:MAG: hypothetical protein QM537_07080 [Candidatus Symbiobacter sp.]|nr:hypothetical protein [Candidatus Symbiobacter sp.]